MLKKVQSLLNLYPTTAADLKQNEQAKRADEKKPMAVQKRPFEVDGALLNDLKSLAAEEEKTAAELAREILAEGVARRRSADRWLTVWKSLTPREKQAASLTCLGYTNIEIAEQMVISPNTVKTYLKKILFRFKVKSKAELRSKLDDWDFSEWLETNLNKYDG